MDPAVNKGIQLLLSLSILVVLHELGHFIPAKLFKTRVEKFYLFFDVNFALFKRSLLLYFTSLVLFPIFLLIAYFWNFFINRL